MSDKTDINKLNAIAEEWNTANPIGTKVMRYKLIRPLRMGNETKTRSKAWVMGAHTVMVKVDGVNGGVMIESVNVL